MENRAVLRQGLCELIGTAILMILGCAGCLYDSPSAQVQSSASFGLAVAAAIMGVGHISGAHVNPAITLSTLILGQKTAAAAGIYCLGQLTGAILGYGLLKLLFDPFLPFTSDFCATFVHPDISTTRGVLSEVVATAILVFLFCALSDPKNAKTNQSIKMGLAVTILCMGFGRLSGGSMNPARSLGPALVNWNWDDHWVYWVGPCVGSTIASFLYKYACMKNLDEDF